jgi:hypothetical protein
MTVADKINKLPKWARDYIHQVHTFVGAPEVQELTYLPTRPDGQIALLTGKLLSADNPEAPSGRVVTCF